MTRYPATPRTLNPDHFYGSTPIPHGRTIPHDRQSLAAQGFTFAIMALAFVAFVMLAAWL
jgi:hypothetical protein